MTIVAREWIRGFIADFFNTIHPKRKLVRARPNVKSACKFCRPFDNGFAQRREIGQAGFVGDDDFAVDDRVVRLKLQGDLGEAAVF